MVCLAAQKGWLIERVSETDFCVISSHWCLNLSLYIKLTFICIYIYYLIIGENYQNSFLILENFLLYSLFKTRLKINLWNYAKSIIFQQKCFLSYRFPVQYFNMDKSISLFDLMSKRQKKPEEVKMFSGTKTPKLQEVSLLLSTVCSNQA